MNPKIHVPVTGRFEDLAPAVADLLEPLTTGGTDAVSV